MRKMSPLIVLLLHLSAVYCDSHSLRYYKTVVSAPGSGLPVYSIVGYVDDQEIVNYNSDTRRMKPKVSWMEEEKKEYWERNTEISKGNEAWFRHNVKIAMNRFNQSGGFHILQWMHGCELRDDGSIRGYMQLGYDGREFMSLDTQTWTFIPTMPQAQITTQRWNSPEEQEGERWKNYIENICIEYLKKYVEHGREDLERRVRPEVKVSGQEKDGILKLQCMVYGFHPRTVDVKWMNNMEDDIPDYVTTGILPHPDGTYQIRVTAELLPKEGESYSCYVDHSSLEGKPLYKVWEPKKSSIRVIAGIIAGVLVLLAVVGAIVGFVLYKRKKPEPVYTSASNSDNSDLPNNAERA